MIRNVLAGTKCLSCRPWVLSALSLVLSSECAWSQTQLAAVSGIITDPSGAVVPGAQVTIVNQRTGLSRETLTDITGDYRLAGLPPGNYGVRIEKNGFQTQVREGITLTSASETLISVSLTVGDQRQEVAVTAIVTAIDNTTTTAGGLVAEEILTTLPLNGRGCVQRDNPGRLTMQVCNPC